jgi:predicted RNA binding protein YcfA (HicA-like mRNA interferase family)
MRELKTIAESRDLEFELVRRGGNHDIYRLGRVSIPIGRHSDIPEPTAWKIIKEAQNQ